jgi:hypothetical protein
MCGIAGISFVPESGGGNTTGISVFKDLLEENTQRGKHATGLVYVTDKNFEIMKGHATGNIVRNFVHISTEECGIIGHLRFATIGDKNDYENMHPFETDEFIGVHNGSIFNYKYIIDAFGLTPKSECDSEVVYRLFDAQGIQAAKHLYGTYMLVFVEKKNPGVIKVLTNGSKPLIGVQHDKFFAFGSIAEKSFSRFFSGINKNKVKLLAPAPGILYSISNGEVTERQEIPGIYKMTEKEGELRYKLEFKNLHKDHFNKAMPLALSLPAPKVVTSSVVTYPGTTTVYPRNTSNEYNKSFIFAYIKKLMENLILKKEAPSAVLKEIALPTRMFFSATYNQSLNYSLSGFKKTKPVYFTARPKNRTPYYNDSYSSAMFRTLYCLEKFITFTTLFKKSYLFEDKQMSCVAAEMGITQAHEFIAALFVSPESVYFNPLCMLIKDKLIDGGALDPEIKVFPYSEAPSKFYKYSNIETLPYNNYMFTVYALKKQVGISFDRDRSYIDTVRDTCYNTAGLDVAEYIQKILYLALILLKVVEVDYFELYAFDRRSVSKKLTADDSFVNQAIKATNSIKNINALFDGFLETEDATEQKLHVGLMNCISTCFPSIFFANNENENSNVIIPNGNDLYYTAFETIEDNSSAKDKDAIRFNIASNIIEYVYEIRKAINYLATPNYNYTTFSLKPAIGDAVPWSKINNTKKTAAGDLTW